MVMPSLLLSVLLETTVSALNFEPARITSRPSGTDPSIGPSHQRPNRGLVLRFRGFCNPLWFLCVYWRHQLVLGVLDRFCLPTTPRWATNQVRRNLPWWGSHRPVRCGFTCTNRGARTACEWSRCPGSGSTIPGSKWTVSVGSKSLFVWIHKLTLCFIPLLPTPTFLRNSSPTQILW